MDIAWGDIVKIYGPLALGWVVAALWMIFASRILKCWNP